MTRTRSARAFLDEGPAGSVLLRICDECAGIDAPELARCPLCAATASSLRAASGRARLVSWSVVHARPGPDGVSAIRVVAIGELAEGPWWWADLVDVEPSRLSAGMPLRIVPRDSPLGPVPVFTAEATRP